MPANRLFLVASLALFALACPDPTGAPELPEKTLGDTTVGLSVSHDLHATGGKAPLAYTATDLPAGLVLSGSTGVLSGTATAAGNHTIQVTVTDADGRADTAGYPFRVYAAPAFQALAVPDALIGSSYTFQFSVDGGKPPLTWAATASSLPSELTFTASTGTLAGSPTQPGSFSLTVQVTDANGATASRAFSGQIIHPLRIVTTSLPSANTSAAYSQVIQASGGRAPVTFARTSGVLPPGLSLDGATGAITGTPTATGTYGFGITATDAGSRTASADFSIAVFSGVPPRIVTTSLPGGITGQPYSAQLSGADGQGALSWSAATGTLPPGLSLTTGGALSGTPSQAGSFSVPFVLSDAAGQTVSSTLVIEIVAPLVAGSAAAPDAYVGSGYAFVLTASGGKAPYTWSYGSGVPAGLTAAASGSISGSPTLAGTYAFTATVSDGSGQTATRAVEVAVLAPPAIVNADVADASVGVAYSQGLLAQGGKAPYTFSVSGGALPAGLAIAGSAITGTPTSAGKSDFALQVSDANGKTASRSYDLEVFAGLAITTGSLPDGYLTVSYPQTNLTAVGGTAPYSWSHSGTLPPGITLSGGTFSGTPTASGSYPFQVTVTDATSATQTRTLTIVVAPALALTKTALVDGYVSEPYADALTATGGKPGYVYSNTGALPAGVTLSSAGVFSGTPTAQGTATFTAQVQDANSTTATKTLSIAVFRLPEFPATAPPEGSAGAPYTFSMGVTGGKAPLAYSVSSGSAPAGLTLAADGTLSGTPTAAGQSTFTVQVTDANGRAATRSLAVTIHPQLQLTTASLPQAYQNVAYSHTLSATGGKTPYGWTVSGALPAGVGFNAGTLSGTPSVSGDFDLTFSVADATGASASRALRLTVAAPLAITAVTLADAYVGDAYSATFAATGGKAPYTWSATGLPAGLTLNASTGALSGTPSALGSHTVAVTVSDGNATSASRSFALTVYDYPMISTVLLGDAYRTETYSVTPAASGGKAPYTWAVTSGSLPAGISLAPGTGTLSGTPTAAGTASFSLTVTDQNGRTHVRPYSLVTYELPAINDPGALADAYESESYSVTFTSTGGKAPIVWTPFSGQPPPGLLLSTSGQLSGTVLDTVVNAQVYGFAVQATDANGKNVTRGFTITGYQLPEVAPITLTTATEGVTYRKSVAAPEQLAGALGKAPYTFSATGLPGGLSLSSAGVFSGIPAQATAGTHVIAVTVTDAAGRNGASPVQMTVVPATSMFGGGWLSLAPQGSPITDVVTLFTIDRLGRPIPGLGVRVRKNGVEYSPVRQALSSAAGKTLFTGLGLNGTTDTLDVTVNGAGYRTHTIAKVNASVITVLMSDHPVPSGRRGAAMVHDPLASRIHLFGGHDDGIEYTWQGCSDDTVRLEDATTATWSQVIPPGMGTSPAARLDAAAAYLGDGQTLLFGGTECPNFYDLGDTWLYDSTVQAWQPVPSPGLAPRTGATMLSGAPGQVFMFGGESGGLPYRELWRFDWMNGWTLMPNPTNTPPASSFMAGAVRNGELWFCGGNADTGTGVVEQAGCWSYAPLTGAWTVQPPLPQTRSRHSMAYHPQTDTFYVFGGLSNGAARNDLLRHRPGEPGWLTELPNGDPSSPSRRYSQSMVTQPNTGTLVLFGGVDEETTSYYGRSLKDTWTFQPATGWAKRTPELMPHAVKLTGTISGAYPTGSSYVYVMATSDTGYTRNQLTVATNGTGAYALEELPAGSTVRLTAISRAPASAGLPSNFYSYVDLGLWGPLTQSGVVNVTFPGPVTPSTATLTALAPANWSSSYRSGSARVSRPGFPAVQNGLTTIVNADTGLLRMAFVNHPGPAVNTGYVFGQNDEAAGCEYSYRYFSGFGPGDLGSFQLPLAMRDMAPGQNPCTPEGSGLAWEQTVASGGTNPNSVAAGRFLGGDPALDVVVANSTSNNVTLFRGSGKSWDSFVAAGNVATGVDPAAVALANLIGDANLDLVVVNRGSNTVAIHAGTGTGFAAASAQNTYTQNLMTPNDVELADVNNDGRTDLVVLNAVPASIAVFLGGTNGTFTAQPLVDLGGPIYTATDLASGRVNTDTYADVAVSMVDTGGGGLAKVLFGSATGALGGTITLTANANASSVAIGDANADGRGDVAIGNVSVSPLLLYVQGTTGFGTAEAADVGGSVPSVAMADMNGDGRAEVVGSYESATWNGMLLFQLAPVGLQWTDSQQTGNAVSDVRLVDVNGDGARDVLASNGAGYLSTFLGEKPLPSASDATLSLTAPPDAKYFLAYRGAYLQTHEWEYEAPAAPGAMSFSFPLQSTLAAERPYPIGQRAMWDPNFILFDADPNWSWHDTRTQGGADGYVGSQTYGFYRQ